MGKLSDLFGKEVSRKAGRTVTDELWKQENGISAYRLGGKIFVLCGVGWILISLIPMICKNPIGDYMWMWVLSLVQIVMGAVLVILSNKSEKFREWAERDFEKGFKKKENLEEKVKIGKVTLPMIFGDVLALKILGIIAVIFTVIMGIGYLKGLVKW